MPPSPAPTGVSAGLQASLTAMQEELAAIRGAAEPLANAADRVSQLRDRLPGGS